MDAGQTPRAILFVDDEPNLLAALRRTMHTLGTDYTVAFASGADEAIKLSAERSFDIVISDMRMPGMDGAELLQLMRRSHPEAIRIVLSGQASLESTIRALTATHQYLAKPYSFQKLKSLIKSLSDSNTLIPSGTIRKHISQIASLPCQRSAVNRFREVVQRQEIDRADLLVAIKRDLGLMATVIHVALSLNPLAVEKITSVESALALLSAESLRALIDSPNISLAAEESYHGVDLAQLAAHSLGTARIARHLASLESNSGLGLAELAGLLHDVGKLVIAQCFGDLCFAPHAEEDKSSSDVERQRELLGVTHAEAGAYLLTLWGMPKEVIDAVRAHHSVPPVAGASLTLSELIYIANVAAHTEESLHLLEGKQA